jgi:DNA replication protein DnaC
MPKSKIDKTLQKIAENTSKVNSPTISSISTLGDPTCQYCHGAGYLRRDVPLDHPEFGKLEICICRRSQIAQKVGNRLFSMSRLDELSEMTFDNFSLAGNKDRKLTKKEFDSLVAAKENAEKYVHSIKDGRWLILMGGFGCGKTHLAAAIANSAISVGVPTLFLTVPDLLDTLRFSYDSEDTTFEQRFNEIRNASLLVLDDFGTQNATAWAQEKLFQIVNYRYINHLSTIITTNLPLEEIDERILSRLQDTELVQKELIQAPDYRRPHQDTRYSKLSSLEFLSDRTFHSFQLRRSERLLSEELQSLEKALAAAKHFATDPHGWIVFVGPYGCGKTHLAAAIANQRVELGDSPLFVMVPDLLDHLRATFSPSSSTTYDRRFDEIRTSSLLILDDLGTQSMTPWVREKLYQLFNHRYNAKLPTVITSADKLEEMDARIRSRMIDESLCTIYGITAPTYHGESSRKAKR